MLPDLEKTEEKLIKVSTIDRLQRRKAFESFSDSITQCLDLIRDQNRKASRRLGEVVGLKKSSERRYSTLFCVEESQMPPKSKRHV